MFWLMLVFKDFNYFDEGGPVHANTFSNWFMVEFPGKSGFPFMISPIIQPKLHISIYLE